MKNLCYITLLLFTTIACKKSNQDVTKPIVSNEEELITSVELALTGPDSAEVISVYRYADLDGDGGNPPNIDTIRFQQGTSYQVSIRFLNETTNPVTDITPEIKNEAMDHLVCFTSSITNVSFEKTDTDGVYPLGLASTWTHSGIAENGTLTITLMHQPDIKNGSCEIGETDVQIMFPMVIHS